MDSLPGWPENSGQLCYLLLFPWRPVVQCLVTSASEIASVRFSSGPSSGSRILSPQGFNQLLLSFAGAGQAAAVHVWVSGAHLACRSGSHPLQMLSQMACPRHGGHGAGPCPPLPLTGACVIRVLPHPLPTSRCFFLPPGGCGSSSSSSEHICCARNAGGGGGADLPTAGPPSTAMNLIIPYPVLHIDCHNLPVDLLRPGAQGSQAESVSGWSSA